MHPLYYDIFTEVDRKEKEKINLADYTTNVIKQSLLGAQENPLKKMSFTKREENKPPHPREARMIISKDFSKSNLKNDDVSKMKVFDNKLSDQN